MHFSKPFNAALEEYSVEADPKATTTVSGAKQAVYPLEEQNERVFPPQH
jgi:hypothetical protein